MNKIMDLRKKRASIWNEAKAFLDVHRGEDGLLSDEDSAVYEKMEADVVKLGQEIQRLEEQARIEVDVYRTPEVCEPLPPMEEVRNASIKMDIQEAYKILMEMDAMLSEFESIVCGHDPHDEKRKDACCLCDEARMVTGLAYENLQKILRIKNCVI